MINPNISKRYFLIPIVLTVFLLLFYLVYKDIKDRTINEFNQEQFILAETASQGIKSSLTEIQSDLAFLSQFNEIIDFTESSRALLSSFHENHCDIIEAVTRVDANGVILFTYPENESAIGKDISDQKHVQEVIATHQPVISDVFTAVQGYLAIALHVPIFKGNEYTGSLAMLISIDKLGKLYLGKIKIRGAGSVWLLSENGIEIYCPVSGHTGKSFLDNTTQDTSSYVLLKKIEKENSGAAKSIHPGVIPEGKTEVAEQYVTFYRVPLGNTYWTIIISYLEEDVHFTLTRLRNRLILVFSFLFIVILYYFYSLTKVRTLLKEEGNRKKAEKTLRESEEKFRRIFEDHTAVKLLIDPKSGEIIDANHAAANYYGWSREELKRMKIEQINTLSPEELKKNIQHVLSREVNNFEFRHRQQDGSIRDVEVFSSKIRIGNKDVLHSIIHDITDRKKAEEELINAKDHAEESDRLKSAFLANMSHEIRTPMNAILGFAGLLQEADFSEKEKQNFIRIIEKSGNRLLNLLNDIIDISKIESGQIDITLSEISVKKEIDEIYTFFKPEAEQKGIHLLVEIPERLKETKVQTDRVKFFAILSNLIKNAIKFTHAGSIVFGYIEEGDCLQFFVKDTGTGIPDDKKALIFERFRQGSESYARNYEGAGLGLSITKAYVELLGGKIWVESKPGTGSVFYFTIPYIAMKFSA